MTTDKPLESLEIVLGHLLRDIRSALTALTAAARRLTATRRAVLLLLPSTTADDLAAALV